MRPKLKNHTTAEFWQEAPGAKHEAIPYQMAARPELVPVMTGSGNRNGFSTHTDRLPTVPRAGSQDAYKLPSVFGGRQIEPKGK